MFERVRSLFFAVLFIGNIFLTGCISTETVYNLTDTVTPYGGSYTIVISEETNANKKWREVATALLRKHPNAAIVLHKNPLTTPEGAEEVRAQLAKLMPARTAFIAQPSECGRDAIAAIHRLTRKLDDDPWLDTQWGVITGANAASALRLASADSNPLIVRNALSTTGLNTDLFNEHFLIRDDVPGAWKWKKPDDPITGEHQAEETGNFQSPEEDIVAFAEHFSPSKTQSTDAKNSPSETTQFTPPDLIVTSFHGFENGVEMPFSRGILRVGKGGKLYAFSDPRQMLAAQNAAPLPDSPTPKVYFPVGNCLVGHVDAADCMVTAMMGRYGVRQMAGYTVNTWFGRGGWGMLDLWQTHPGNLSFSEAFFLNQQWMLHDIEAIDPAALHYKMRLGTGDVKIWHHLAQMLQSGLKFDPRKVTNFGVKSPDRQLAGLLWDKDTVAFYGDPAWVALLRKTPGTTAAFSAEITSVNNHHTLLINVRNRAKMAESNTPIGFIFGTRLNNPQLVSGAEYKPVLADNFLLLLNPIPPSDSNEIIVEFTGEPLPHPQK